MKAYTYEVVRFEQSLSFFNYIGKDILYGGIRLAQEGRIASQGVETSDSVIINWLLIAPDDNVILLQFKKIALVDRNQCDYIRSSLQVNNTIYVPVVISLQIFPLVTNEHSHPYHLDESILILRAIRNTFSFLFHFSMKIV